MTFAMVLILSLFVYQTRSLIAMVFTNEPNILRGVKDAFKVLATTLIFHGLGLV